MPDRDVEPMHTTTVIPNARLEMLRALARVEDIADEHRRKCLAAAIPDYWPTHAPLFVGDWKNDVDDIDLAAREAAAIGDIEFHNVGHPNGPMVKITPQGYAWIRAHDAIEETAQEARR